MTSMDAISNKQLVRNFLTVFYKSHSELRALCHPKVQLHFRGNVMANGIDELVQYAHNLKDSFPDLSFDIQHIVAESYAASAHLIQRGHQKQNWYGIESQGHFFEVEEVMFFDIEERRITHIWSLGKCGTKC